MPSYDASNYDPPAPIAHVTLRNPANGATVSDVLLLIDSGADITLLPRTAVDGIGIAPIAGQEYEIAGFDGRASFAPAATLDMVFLRRVFRGRYLLIDDDRGTGSGRPQPLGVGSGRPSPDMG